MFTEFRLLKEIVKRREVTMKQLREMVPRKFGDHRDYYEIAGLLTGGYLECTMHKQGDPKQFPGATAFDHEELWFSGLKEVEVARQIYSMTLGPGDHEYLGVKYLNPSPILDELIFPTGKAFLHFNSERQTRNDRIAALAIGLIVGIVTAAATVYLTVLASTATDEPWTYRDETRGIEWEFQPDQPLQIVLEMPSDEKPS